MNLELPYTTVAFAQMLFAMMSVGLLLLKVTRSMRCKTISP